MFRQAICGVMSLLRPYRNHFCHGCMENDMTRPNFTYLVPGASVGRFDGIERPYGPEDVLRLRGSVAIRHTLAERGASRLWDLLQSEAYVPCLGAMTGNQAMQ